MVVCSCYLAHVYIVQSARYVSIYARYRTAKTNIRISTLYRKRFDHIGRDALGKKKSLALPAALLCSRILRKQQLIPETVTPYRYSIENDAHDLKPTEPWALIYSSTAFFFATRAKIQI